MKQKIIPIVSVLIGVLAFFLTDRFLKGERAALQRARDEFNQQTRQLEVVVAARDLSVGTPLAQDDIAKTMVPAAKVGRRAVLPSQFPMLLGRKLGFSIAKGDPIQWSDVEGGSTIGGTLSRSVNEGLRAISLSIGGAQGVSGMVAPGDRVDVLGTFSLPSPDNPLEVQAVTLTVLQNVTVLATGQTLPNDTVENPGARRGSGYSTVTVEVSPQEAELLVFAELTRGRLSLALRNPEDVLYMQDLPKVDFRRLEEKLPSLNEARQRRIGGRAIRNP
jgi:pilus assembly protein CpaB